MDHIVIPEGEFFMQKKEQEKEQTLVTDVIKILFVMYLVTCILLLLLALVLYKSEPGEMVSKVDRKSVV